MFQLRHFVSLSWPKDEMKDTHQIIITIPSLGRIHGFQGLELVKHALRRLRPIIEQEHNPCVQERSMFCGHNDGRFVVRVVVSEVAHGLEHLGRLGSLEDVISAPDFADRVRLEGV